MGETYDEATQRERDLAVRAIVGGDRQGAVDAVNRLMQFAISRPDAGTAPDGTVAIPGAEYEGLLRDSRVLAALYAGGVDDWEWYGASLEALGGD